MATVLQGTNPYTQFDEDPYVQFDAEGFFTAQQKRAEETQQKALDLQAQSNLRSMEEQIGERQFIKEQYPNLVPIKYDVDDSMLQFRLAQRETIEEQINELEKWEGLPAGAKVLGIQTVNGLNAVGFVQDDSLFIVNGGDQGNWEKVLASVASFETIGSVVAGLVYPPSVAGKVLRMALWEAAAAMAGKTVDEAIEFATDRQRQEIDELAKDVGIAGIVAGGASTAVSWATKTWNLLIKGGFRLGHKVPKGSTIYDEVLESSRQEGMSIMAKPGSALGRSEQQAEALALTDAPTEFRAELMRSIESLHDAVQVGEISQKQMMGALEGIEKKARFEVEREVRKYVPKVGDVPKKVGGDAYEAGVKYYRESSGITGEQKYNEWFDAALEKGAAYDLQPLFDSVEHVTKRVSLRAEREVPSAIVDASGKPIRTITEEYDKYIPSQHEAQLTNIIELTNDLKRLQVGDPREATIALKKIRTQLRELSEKDLNQISLTESQLHAKDMLNAMHEVISNPISTDKNVARLGKEAGEYWGKRADVLDAIEIRGASDGEELFKRITGKLTEPKIKSIQKHLPKEQYEIFRAAVASDLLSNPNKLKLLNERAYKHMIPKPARQALNLWQKEMKGLNSGVLSKAIEKRLSQLQKLRGMIVDGSKREIDEMVERGIVSRGHLQDGIYSNLIENISTFKNGRHILVPKKFTSEVQKLKKSHMWEYLTKSQQKSLSNHQIITSVMKTADDAGNSLMAASTASQQAQFLHPIKAGGARINAIQKLLMSRLSRNPKVVETLYGSQLYTLTAFRAGVLGTIQSLHQLIGDERIGSLNGE